MRRFPAAKTAGTVLDIAALRATFGASPGPHYANATSQKARRPVEPQPRALRWHVDEITDAGVVGWVFSPDQVMRRCIVALQEGRRLHARAVASRHRPNLKEAGVGDGNCAFLLPLPYCLLDGEEHVLDIIEEATGTALTEAPLRFRCTAGTSSYALNGRRPKMCALLPPDREGPADLFELQSIELQSREWQDAPRVKSRLLFDVSDFIHYLAEAAHLTGIQRVQASVLQALLDGALPPACAAIFISVNDTTGLWEAIPTHFLSDLVRDLVLPAQHRTTRVAVDAARIGHLPGARPFDAAGILDDGTPSVVCLLGAGWNRPDHLRHILAFKRRFGTRFVMLVHDLLPMVARDTCNAVTAAEFDAFLHRAARHVDHFLAVSQNTANDLRQFLVRAGHDDGVSKPGISVIRNGSSFIEFLPSVSADDGPVLPARFVLYVSTIECRKNHSFLLKLWRRMVAAGDNPPHLVCVGHIGWRADAFITALAESNNLDGLIIIYQDVSDSQLRRLYERCLFTVYPSLYEGWGLPVGESLAAGKICLCSTRASLPEVAGDVTPCLDLEDVAAWLSTLRLLLTDDAARHTAENLIRSQYRPISWTEVSTAIALSCGTAASAPGRRVDPYPIIPYATEISFAASDFKADPILLPGDLTEAGCIAAEEARGDGMWAAPEPWGTWLCQGSGDLQFILHPSESRIFYVFLRLRTSAPAANAPASISTNTGFVWHGRFTEKPQTIILRLRRPAATDGRWRLILQFNIEISAAAKRDIAAMDQRMPHLGVERLLVVPQDDVKTRLDALTSLHIAGSSSG